MSSFIPRSLLDQYPAETQDPTYRASMLPIGTYPNASGSGEHLGLAIPGMIQEPMNALSRLIGTPSSHGTFGYGPDYGSNADDMRTLLETFLGGNATRGMGAVERGAVEAAPKFPHPDFPAADLTSKFRAYHGTTADFDGPFQPSTNGTFGQALYAAYDDPKGYGKGADFAGNFADELYGGNYDPTRSAPREAGSPKIFPLDVNGKIASGDQWNNAVQASGSADAAAHLLRQQGFDGASLDGELGLWNRGTVTSPLTGETLFSDQLPSLWGSAVSSNQNSSQPRGQVTPGNIDLGARPVVANPDGSYSTVRSISVDQNGHTVLLPTVSDDGRIMPNQEAIQHYLKTGRHLGIFDTPDNADAYGESLHEDQARRYTPQMALPTTVVPDLPQYGTPYTPNSLWGSALQGQQEPRNSLFAQNNQGAGDYLKNRADQPWEPKPGEDYQYTITPEIDQQLTATARPHINFLLDRLKKEYPNAPPQNLSSRAYRMFMDHPSDDYLELKKKLIRPTPY